MKKEIEDIEVQEITYSKDRGLEMRMQHPLVYFMVEEWVKWFKDMGGTNYVECSIFHEDLGPMTLTLQRELGKTPATKLSEVEKKLEWANREIAILRQYGNKDCTAMADDALAALKSNIGE